jgi:chromatin remodeling complex protein RSC6
MPVSKTSTKKTTKTEETVVAPAPEPVVAPAPEPVIETPAPVAEKKTKGGKKAAAAPVETPVAEPAPVAAPVEAATTEAVAETAVAETAVAETSEEQSIQERVASMLEMNRMMGALHGKIQKQLKALEKDYRSFVRRFNKMEEKRKQNKKKGGSTGLKKMIPVTTASFKTFVEKFHGLKDKHEQVVYAELQYDAAGNLLISREQALRLVNAYIADKKLQKFAEDKKRIKMDPQLKTLFPMLCEHKDASGNVVEENCYFHTLMKGIATHLQSNKTD